MRIALLAIPGSMRSALAGIADMFWLANQIIVQNPQVNADIARTSPFFEVMVVTSDGLPVMDVQGEKSLAMVRSMMPNLLIWLLPAVCSLTSRSFPSRKRPLPLPQNG
jgi:hypothetical protein